MTVQPVRYPTRCDIGSCPNRASIAIVPSNGDPRGSIFLCQACAEQLAHLLPAQTPWNAPPAKREKK